MKRIDAIRNIMNTLNEKDVVVSSCGHISREVYYVKDRPRNFYVMGSMGACLPVAIGVALCKPDTKVIAIIGDGEALMGLDSLILLKHLQRKYESDSILEAAKYIKEYDLKKVNNFIIKKRFNLDLYILDNGEYESTGGQPSISKHANFRTLCDCKVIYVSDSEIKVPRINIPHESIKRRFMNAIKN